MARNPKPKKKNLDRRPKPGGAAGRTRRAKPKVCMFCRGRATWVDYKDVDLLRRFINDRGRIKARAATGTCAQHQRDVATAVKTARILALLPFAVRTVSTEQRGGRRGGPRSPLGTVAGSEGSGAGAEAEDDLDPEDGDVTDDLTDSAGSTLD